uniref:Uncharacterized protein n=1 Tax=Trichogramma kaykai TaxID=54128 RepID=A0ABD2XG54_9HYME
MELLSQSRSCYFATAAVHAISTMQSSAAAFSMENNHSFAYRKRNREGERSLIQANTKYLLKVRKLYIYSRLEREESIEE